MLDERFTDVVRAHLPDARWRVDRAGPWTHVTPPDTRHRDQGWKIHISAAAPSAEEVLDRVAPVLVAARCPFKFAATPAEIARMTGRHFDRGSAGKFLTVYPPADDGLPELARALDEATGGLPGPRILSDRPYRPGSLVHFRYGGFARRLRLAVSGVYEPVVTAPDGTCVADRREAWFEPPPWAPPRPFSDPPAPAAAPRGVLLDDRFLLRGAIRHANKGGVFRATDQETGEEVVVKQARAHVEVRPGGGDVRDLLRNEARMLERLAPTGLVPGLRALVELPEHTFLVAEAVPGVPLDLRLQRLYRTGRPGTGEIRRIARRLVDLVAAVHREGVVIRDLTPANVIIGTDGGLRLIDLELAGVPGEEVVPGGSPGYAPPEQWTDRRTTPAADRYALGMILFALATGAEPVLLAEDGGRDARERIAAWLAHVAPGDPLAAEFAPAILGLIEPDPARRLRLDQVSEPAPVRLPPAGDDTARLLDDGLTYLIRSGGRGLDPEGDAGPGTERWWPADAFGQTTDPCNVYYGAAGILGVLADALRHRPGEELRAATARAARWLDRQAAREPVVLPGLQFGRSGTYWALLEAAEALGDPDLAARTAGAARRLPTGGAVPDVCHGIAGSGLTALRFWRHTGQPVFLDRAGECADALLTAAVPDADGIAWPVPAQPPYLKEGGTHYGFAHGTAGVAAFLLDAAAVTGRADCLAAAHLAGRTLRAAALWDDGAAWWSSGPADDVPRSGWCSGAAGVGAFLLRLWRATGDKELLAAVRGAALAVHRDAWRTRPVHCHGTAGSVDYLMGVAEATGEERYAAWAREAATALAARAAVRDGLLLTPDHTGVAVFPSLGVGTAGVVAALLRLDGAPAFPFMPPNEFPGGAPAPRTCGVTSHGSESLPERTSR